MTASASPLDQISNIEAEQALLGALLVNNAIFDRVSGIVKAGDFYDPVHARIFEVIAEKALSGSLASPVTLKAAFTDDEGMQALGGSSYLIRLAGAAISLLAAPDYAKVVADLARRRELWMLLDDGKAALVDPEKDVPAILGSIESWSLAQEATNENKVVSFMAAVTKALRHSQDARESGTLPGLPTGIATLDALTGGLHDGDLIIVAGRPSMGKSACSLQFAINVARAGHGVGFASLEMTETQLAWRALSEHAARAGRIIPYQDMRLGQFDDASWDCISNVAHDAANLPIRIMPPGVRTVGGIMSSARQVARYFEARKQQLRLLIVDYLQIMQAVSRGNANERTAELSGALKAVARHLSVPVIALSQLSRAVEQRDDKRPTLADLRDSGAIEQDADVVIFPYREEYYLRREKPKKEADLPDWHASLAACAGHIELIVAKQRMGPTGVAPAIFDERTNWLRDLPKGHPEEHSRDFA